MSTNNLSQVSIIIPTRNSAKTVAKCLQSLRDQTYQPSEILIIDGHSTDRTQEIAEKFGAKVMVLEGERATAKNLGIAKSLGSFLLFLDSDMILEPTVIEECMKIAIENTKIVGIVIPERSIGTSFWVKVRDFERSLYAGSKIESARFFRREDVLAVGGFDEETIFYEESTLPQKLEKKGQNVDGRISSYILHDEGGFSLRRWLTKKQYYSKTFNIYSTRYHEYARLQFSISYRLRTFVSGGQWKKLLRNPLLTLGLLVLKSLEYLYSKGYPRSVPRT